MKVLILSTDGDGLSIAYKLVMEGHTVDMWIKKPQYKHDLKGIIGRPSEWRPLLPQADLVICDMVGFSQHMELFQKMGKPFLCCNPVADVMELDRLKGLETFRRSGIDQPEYWHYKSPQEAISALDDIWESDGLVFKPFGNIDVGKTYCVEDKELARWALSTYPPGTQLIVQCKIPESSAVEISTEGWFNGREFISPFNHTLEEKKLMVGNLGKMTGCMGNLVFTTKGDKLVDATVRKLEPILKKSGYRGPIDINCMVTKDKALGLELTCRFGYDAIEALMQGLREPMANLLFETAIGSKTSMDITSDFLMSVRVVRDPYPVDPMLLAKHEQDLGMPIMGLNKKDMDHVYLCDAYLDNGIIRYGASDGVLLKATSFGRSIDEARSRVYTVVQNIKGIDIMYRTDIGQRAIKDLERLRSWGWIN
jgi:phosphoribosylamine---glycine ligase